MSVPAIALYAAAAAATATSPAAAGPAAPHRPATGGLSCLFSSPSVASASSGRLAGDDFSGDFSGGCSYSCSNSYSSPPFKCRDQYSPASVLQGPSPGSTVGARSPPRCDWRASRDRLFDGFVTSALGSCLEYIPPASAEDSDVDRASVSAGELAFTMDENLSDAMEPTARYEPFVKTLLASAQARHRIFEDELVVKAFFEAAKAHQGQKRASGDPYLLHCVETAELLAQIGANATVVSAGLLHDAMDDSFFDYDYIFMVFGAAVADLVEGVSRLSQLSKLARENNTANRTAEADRLHTMFLAMADARAVLIKLADRLHNMRTLEALPLAKQKRISKETLEIFVPLAHRLGISSWKDQLESACFKHLHPEEHRELSSKLEKSFSEALITSAKEKLEIGLQDQGVPFHCVVGRHKSLYSIYSKMHKKNLRIDEINDIHGLRLLVETEEECYRALDVVHGLWPKVVGKFKDYIVKPKANGYRSLHTVVSSEGGNPFEIQIRTREMHLHAEYGIAAHWRYKQGGCMHSFVPQVVEWARWVVTWQCETANNDNPSPFGEPDIVRPPCSFPSHAEDCPYSYTHQCKHSGPIFVILLKHDWMTVQEFPANSTVTDLLDRIGSSTPRWSLASLPLKEELLRLRVNRMTVSDLSQTLNMGDIVELTPPLADKSLVERRAEFQRMYDGSGLTYSGRNRCLS